MNGRALNEKAIEVSPSSSRVLDRAAEILTPFPPSKNRPRPAIGPAHHAVSPTSSAVLPASAARFLRCLGAPPAIPWVATRTATATLA